MNIITALNNPNINNKLKDIKEFNIIGNDVQYQEGIKEMLEKNGEIPELFSDRKLQNQVHQPS